MRALSALGALAFLYLALVPGGLLASTLESACAGEGCASAPIARLGFVALYGVCLLALLGCSLLFAHHALSGSLATQRRLGRGLRVAAAVVGGTLLALFAAAFPFGAVLAVGGGLLALAVVLRWSRERPASAATSSNGGAPTNGSGPHPGV